MKILGIETSCDETAAAVVENGTKIRSNVVASSVELHIKTGGIIPEQAARQQVRSILPVIGRAVAEAARISNFQFPISNELLNDKIQNWIKENIDAVAVTAGPGLIGSLLVGVETAKTLAYLWKKPIMQVNHLVGHIYANWLETEQESKKVKKYKEPKFPALALVVSGGHTDLVLMRGHGDLEWIGGTRDDAAGEAFDKCARLLGLGYPGGPAISAASEKYQMSHLHQGFGGQANDELQMFPRPMIGPENFDWSFSGLKTAVLRETQKLGSNLQPQIPKLAAEVQEAIVDVLVVKTLRAVKKYKPKSLLLAGGVAANSRLREKFNLEIVNCKLKIDFKVPPPKLCTDNAASIASCAFFNNSTFNWSKIMARPELTIVDQL